MFTFWKCTRLQLLREKSANRTVITVFKPIRTAAGLGGDADGKTFAVVNCHLSAGEHGDAPRKRLQQVADGLETARKEIGNATGTPAAKKKKGGGSPTVPEGGVCVVGDFNSDATDPAVASVVAHFLRTGEVASEFRERASGNALTSKAKRHRFGGLADAYGEAYPTGSAPDRPASYIAPSLIPKFVGNGSTGGERNGLTVELVEAVARIYDRFSPLNAAGIRTWIEAVNGTHSAEVMAVRNVLNVLEEPEDAAAEASDSPKSEEDNAKEELQREIASWVAAGYRGSEFRHALTLLSGRPGGLASGVLSLDDFMEAYALVVTEGKFWSVEHDVAKLGVWPGAAGEIDPPFEGTFDYIFYGAERKSPIPSGRKISFIHFISRAVSDGLYVNVPAGLELQAVRAPLTKEQRALVDRKGVRFPCEWHMSDHLPVAACFRFK